MSLLPFPKEVDNRLSILEAVGTIYGKYTATSTINTFTIPESTFDPSKQELVLIYKNLSLTKDVNYTQNEKVITLAFYISAGEYIEYEIHRVASGGVPGAIK